MPKTETINPKTIDSAALNLAVVRGEVSSPPDVRVLPSEAVLVQLQVTTRLEHETLSTPIAVWNPPAWVEELEPGTEVVPSGSTREAQKLREIAGTRPREFLSERQRPEHQEQKSGADDTLPRVGRKRTT